MHIHVLGCLSEPFDDHQSAWAHEVPMTPPSDKTG
jgi:hypothetical protein